MGNYGVNESGVALYRCKCGVTRRYPEATWWPPQRKCPSCGKWVEGNAVVGTENERIKCGPKCRSAKGPDCECSCGGQNHGEDWL